MIKEKQARLEEIERSYKLGPNNITPFTKTEQDLKWAITELKSAWKMIEVIERILDSRVIDNELKSQCIKDEIALTKYYDPIFQHKASLEK